MLPGTLASIKMHQVPEGSEGKDVILFVKEHFICHSTYASSRFTHRKSPSLISNQTKKSDYSVKVFTASMGTRTDLGTTPHLWMLHQRFHPSTSGRAGGRWRGSTSGKRGPRFQSRMSRFSLVMPSDLNVCRVLLYRFEYHQC